MRIFTLNMRIVTLKCCLGLLLSILIIYLATFLRIYQDSTRNTLLQGVLDDMCCDEKYQEADPEIIRGGKRYKIAVIADLDEERSKSPGKPFEWRSYIKIGFLNVYNDGRYEVNFTTMGTLTTNLNEKGRGLELSELCMFNNRLYSVDDRTGVVYQILNNEPIPWVILTDGAGSNKKGFKSEWMTVKDGVLYVGSTGKEWTTKTGDIVNYNPMFVKSITDRGEVRHHNWTDNYLAIRRILGIEYPGYIMHEAVMWSHRMKKWIFLPRRMSMQKYNDQLDERRGTNVLISASFDFTEMHVVYVGDLDTTHGFSTFKFIPRTNNNLALAVKSKEVDGDISSYIMVFDINTGDVLMKEQLIGYDKYEGIEFLL